MRVRIVAGAGMTGRLALLVRTAALLALVCVGLAGWGAARGPLPDPRAGMLTVALLCAGVAIRVRTRVGAQQLELAWGEAALMLALVLVPPAWVVLLTPLGVGLGLLRRQPAVKAVYNVSIYTIGSAAGAAIAALAQPLGPGSVSGMVALVAAGVVGGLITHVAVAAVIAVAQDIPVTASWRAGEGLQLLSTAGNTAAAAVVLVLAHRDPLLVAALPVLGLSLHQGYVGRLRSREERTLAQRQLRAVNAFTGELDEALVASRAAAEIVNLLAADVVEVELYARVGRPATLHRHPRRGQPWSGPPERAPDVAGRLVTQVPISGGLHPLGLIRVWLAGGDASLHLSIQDDVAIRTFAIALQTALANAETDDRLRKLAERQDYQATHDQVTALPTHDLLLDHVESRLARPRARGTETPVAACVIDISGFREIVSTLGRAAAQRLLRHAADQLRARAAPGDYLAHLDGDSLAVFVQPAHEPEQLRAHVLSLLAAIGHPVRPDPAGTEVSLDAAAGIAYCATPTATTAADLLRQATVALDHARSLGVEASFYEPEHDTAGPSALVLASELRTGLDRRQLELQYQPIVDLTHYWPLAVEASVRWLHPTRGVLRPEEFLPVLHHSPSDHARFVRWYLDQAVSERSRWGHEDLPIAVNLDARSLLDQGLVDHVARTLGRAGLAPDQLTIELKDTATLSTLDTVDHVLAQLRYLGIRLAVDDFGAGHTSLARLLRLPATDLKIASELIIDMLKSEQTATVIRAAIDIGRSLGHRVTALGVTTAEQAAALRDLNCPAAQGHHLIPALTPARLHAYLAEAPRKPTSTPADVILLQTRRPSTASDHRRGR
jgi:diguanylate cyclase (GGDEF)-like protein